MVSKFLILLLSIFMLSTAPALVKMINLNPLVGLSWRLSIVSLALLPFAFDSLKKLRRSTVLKIGFVSSVLFVHFWTWFAGVRLLNVSYTATIFAINPVFAALLGKVILKEKFQLRFAFAMVTSFAGISYAFLGNRLEVEGSFSVFGCILILVSAFFYALYMVLSKKLRASVDNSLYTFTLNSLAGVMGWIAVAVAFYFNGSENMSVVIPAQEQVGFLVALAIGPSLLGHTLMIYSLPSFNINFVSVLKLLSPISASLIGVLVFGDIIDTRLVLGFCLVLSGVCLALPLKRRTKS